MILKMGVLPKGLQNLLSNLTEFFSKEFKYSLLDKAEIKTQLKLAKKTQEVETEVEIQRKLFNISIVNYNEMKNYGIKNKLLVEKDIKLIDLMIKALSTGKQVPNKVQVFDLKRVITLLIENEFEIVF